VSHPAYNRTRAQGNIATVVVTATGFDHPVRGFQVQIGVGSEYVGVPDVWRFEPGGCAEGGFQAPEIPLDPTCPFLTGPNIQRFSDAQLGYAHERFRYYMQHDPVTVPIGARYTIAQFQFDLSKGFEGLGLRTDGCGCVEQPQGVHIYSASWLAEDGIEYSFAIANECLGWEDPANSSHCPFFGCDLCTPDPPPPPHNPCADQQATAAATKSWGSVKALYR
jgi:hypothetical protein